MHHLSRRLAWGLFLLVCGPVVAAGESPFTLSTMPRIDVHAHIRNDCGVMDEYVALRDALKKEVNVEMAMWISVSFEPTRLDFKELEQRYQGRILWTISDYSGFRTIAGQAPKKLKFSAKDLAEWKERGALGLKFYPGWARGVQIDHPNHEPIFSDMERLGMTANDEIVLRR